MFDHCRITLGFMPKEPERGCKSRKPSEVGWCEASHPGWFVTPQQMMISEGNQNHIILDWCFHVLSHTLAYFSHIPPSHAPCRGIALDSRHFTRNPVWNSLDELSGRKVQKAWCSFRKEKIKYILKIAPFVDHVHWENMGFSWIFHTGVSVE